MGNVAIYGASGLIGKTLVNNFLSDGFNVISCDIDIEERESEKFGLGSSTFIKVDLNCAEEIKKSILRIDEICNGEISVINCAYPRAVSYGKQFFELDLEEFNETIKLHLGAYFNLMKEFAIHSKVTGCRVSFLNFASVYGVIPPRFEIYSNTEMVNPIEYGALKSSIIHMTKYVSKIMKGYNFKINSVSPGGILDRQDSAFLEKYKNYCSMKGMLDAVDIYGCVKFLATDQSNFITGQNIIIDDGFSL